MLILWLTGCLVDAAVPPDVVPAIVERQQLDPLRAELALERVVGPEAHDELLRTWSTDVAEVIAGVQAPLVTDHREAERWPAGNVGRALDVRWFGSPKASFELAGIVPRFDRQAIIGGCGEVRLIYRLSYRDPISTERVVGSRLPVVLNVVLSVPEAECERRALAWTSEGDASLRVLGLPLEQVELNAQVVRFPSGVATETAGQAIYLLRVYAVEGGTIRDVGLENTPDVGMSPGEKAELVAWISEHLSEIDRGSYRIPERFLATVALSYSTLGTNRVANKPFDVLFPGGEGLPDPGASPSSYVRTRAGLVERLDNGTCMGCHQAGSTAGFHFLGRDDLQLTGVTNVLQVPFSPQFAADQPRRAAYVRALVGGVEPDAFRPHSLDDHGGDNAPCLVGEDLDWNDACPAGQGCRVLVKSGAAVQFGQCVPSAEAVTAGMSCREGALVAAPTAAEPYNRDAWRDTFVQQQIYDLPEDKQFSREAYNCRPTVIGVPLGRAYRSCTADERKLSDVGDEICAVVGGSKFDTCVAGSFHDCLDDIVARGMVNPCSAARACREDYICQALPASLPGMPPAVADLVDQGIGFCTPTYFLFQLRLDGHSQP